MNDEVKDEVKDRDEKSGKFLPGNRAQSARKPAAENTLSDLLEQKLTRALNSKEGSVAAQVQLLKAGIAFESLKARRKKPPLVLEPFVGLVVAALQRLNEKLPVPTDVNMVLDSLDQAVDQFVPEVPEMPQMPLSSNTESAKVMPESHVVQRPQPGTREPGVDMVEWAREIEKNDH